VLVTGGTGLVGEPVIRALLARGDSVVALVRSRESAEKATACGASPLLGTVEDPRVWDTITGVDGVIHSAALVAARTPWQSFFQVNVEGTRLAAATARRLGVRLVHISSVAVYGRQAADEPPGSRSEHAPLGPLEEHDFYARSKRLAEEMVRAEVAVGLEAVILRPCVVYGEGDRLFLPRMAKIARFGWLPRIGAGDLTMAVVHAESVADAAVRALNTPRAASRIYQVTNDGDITPREFVAALSEGLGRPITTIPFPEPAALAVAHGVRALLRVVGPGLYPGSITGAVRFWRGSNPYTSARAAKELGWTPSVPHGRRIAELVRRYAAG
jgi:nucleoside-diphosphate-sugar epimerase